MRASWALVEVTPLIAGIPVSDADLETYLKAHDAEYRQPERRKVTYVLVPIRDYIKPVAESETRLLQASLASAAKLIDRSPPSTRLAAKRIAAAGTLKASAATSAIRARIFRAAL